MSLEGTLGLLSNFSRTVHVDNLAYEFFERRLNIAEYRRRIQELVEDVPPNTDPQGTERESELERERRKLSRMLVEAELEKAELELIALALDLKISMVAQRIQEPFPGFFAQVGITADYRLLQRSHQQNGKPHLKLAKG
jgi:hypothetical protein